MNVNIPCGAKRATPDECLCLVCYGTGAARIEADLSVVHARTCLLDLRTC